MLRPKGASKMKAVSESPHADEAMRLMRDMIPETQFVVYSLTTIP